MPDAIGWRRAVVVFHECVLMSLELGSADRAKRCLSEDPAPREAQLGERFIETSDDVIEDDFISTPDSRILDLSPIPLGEPQRRQGNRRNRGMRYPESEACRDLHPYCRKNDSRPRLILFGRFDRRDTHCPKVL